MIVLSHLAQAYRSKDAKNLASHNAKRETAIEGVVDENWSFDHHDEITDGKVDNENV